MTGLSFREFYDALYYGADIEFTLEKWHYMIYCGWENTSEGKFHCIEIVKSDQPFYEQAAAPHVWDTIFESKMKDGNENIQSFLKATLFENRSFCEVEPAVVIEYS